MSQQKDVVRIINNRTPVDHTNELFKSNIFEGFRWDSLLDLKARDFLSWDIGNINKQWHLIKSRKFLSDCFASYTLLSLILSANSFTIIKRLLLYASNKSKWIEFIAIVAKYIIQIQLIEEIKQVKCRFILADEVTNVHLFVYIRIYVHRCMYMCLWTCMYVIYIHIAQRK